jgi:hypothetical protein
MATDSFAPSRLGTFDTPAHRQTASAASSTPNLQSIRIQSGGRYDTTRRVDLRPSAVTEPVIRRFGIEPMSVPAVVRYGNGRCWFVDPARAPRVRRSRIHR